MKIRHIAIPVLMSLTLAACVVDGDPYYDRDDHYGHEHRDNRDRRYDRDDDQDYREHRHEREHRRSSTQNFICENGMKVRVQRLDDDRIRLNTDGQSVVMENAVSASGERYTANSGLFGNGGEWHQKGSEAVFAFTKRHGGQVETACSRD